jgi:2-polyprenyl-3-methyl-5-hydroxy-6-metoxy-1,4-benzoquinol methylase
MSGLIDVSVRRLVPEILDQPGLDTQRHVHALQGLERINLLSLTATAFRKPLRDFAERHPGQPLRLLDLASGAGDTPTQLKRWADARGIRLEVHGCDISPISVEYAQKRAAARNADVSFFVHDVMRDGIPDGFDIVTSSLFLHHLRNESIRDLLRSASRNTRLILVSDLIRGWAGLLLAHAICRVVTRSDIVHNDGPLSVAASFTTEEFTRLAADAGLQGYSIAWQWPFRFLFTWARL